MQLECVIIEQWKGRARGSVYMVCSADRTQQLDKVAYCKRKEG